MQPLKSSNPSPCFSCIHHASLTFIFLTLNLLKALSTRKCIFLCSFSFAVRLFIHTQTLLHSLREGRVFLWLVPSVWHHLLRPTCAYPTFSPQRQRVNGRQNQNSAGLNLSGWTFYSPTALRTRGVLSVYSSVPFRCHSTSLSVHTCSFFLQASEWPMHLHASGLDLS